MGVIVAQWIGAAFTFFLALLFLKVLYLSKTSRFHRHKWVIVASCVMMLGSIVQISNAYRNNDETRVPTKGELQEAIAAHNTLVDDDFVYDSPDGYSLTVPAGYAYTTFPTGALSMTAVKKQSSGQSTILVARQQSGEELESLVTKTIDVLKNKNPTYAFSPSSEVLLGDKKAIRVDLDVEKQGVPIKGVLIFAKTGNTCFEIMMSCPASLYSEESAAFEKAIQSSRIR
jgi:hypothetical protein